MKLSVAVALILVEIGAGVLLMLPLVPITEVRRSYFTFHSMLAAVCLAIAAVVHWFALDSFSTFIGLCVATVFCVGSFATVQMERVRDTRMLHLVAAFLAIFFGMIINVPTPKSPPVWIYWWPIHALLGAVLLGTVHNAMALGHWYLISRKLSFAHLIRITKLLLVAIGIRTAAMILFLVLAPRLAPAYTQYHLHDLFLVSGNLIFFLMRILWGLALPFILAFMAWRCAVGKANQAATGLLYLCEVSVLFGELFAAYLMI